MTILKTSNKSVWSNASCLVKVCIFWKCIQYTIHWDKTQTFKKFPLDKINCTKNSLFFLLRDLTHHSSTFNLQFLYELKHKVCLSKNVCRIFHFRFRFIFIKVYVFAQQNAWTFWIVITHFKMKIIEKPDTVLLSDLFFLSCDGKYEWVKAPEKLTRWQIF